MDHHNRQFHLIYGEQNWLPFLLQQDNARLWWDRERKAVTLAPVIQQVNELNQHEYLQPTQRRGAAFDHYGNVYWINENNDGIFYQPEATPLKKGEFWHTRELHLTHHHNPKQGDFAAKPSPAEFAQAAQRYPSLSGLTVTSCEYLVVGTLASSTHQAGLLIFDLHAGGAPLWLRWPAGSSFSPLDLSCTPDGGIFILDRDPASNLPARVWHLDKHWQILGCNGEIIEFTKAHDFFSLDKTASELASETQAIPDHAHFFTGLDLTQASSNTIDTPVSIEAIANNAFVILDSPAAGFYSAVHYFRNSEYINTVALNEDAIGKLLGNTQIHAQDFAFIPQGENNARLYQGSLYISASRFFQAFEFQLQATNERLQLAMQAKLLPMRALTGKALIASGQGAWYDFGDRWLPLAEQPLKQYQSRAELSGLVFDGEEPDCVWHRMIIDARIPPGTSVQIYSRAANTVNELNGLPWQTEPPFYKRAQGSELVHTDAPICADEHSGSFEFLFQAAEGRYLELRLQLVGTRQKTPLVRTCRIYYPRYSWLKRFLPAVYQDDERSSAFLDRFLANLEGLYTHMEDKIAHAEMLFDTRTAPPEFLEWLGQWLGAFVDPLWDEKRKRLFIDNAALLFNWRGTLACLRALIKLSIDECPDTHIFDPLRFPERDYDGIFAGRNVRIVEHFLTRRIAQTDTSPTSTTLALHTESHDWQPLHGASALHKLYQQFIAYKYHNDIAALKTAWGAAGNNLDSFARLTFPPLIPTDATQASLWEEFTRDHIGFTYPPVSNNDLAIYQQFLQLRYQHIGKFNAAHGLVGKLALSSFFSVNLPTRIPENKVALIDWIEFVSLSLPIQRQAHQFTVYLPTTLGELPAQLATRKAQVEAIVQREKPAHTHFDVKFFWAMFQVGSARLGIDTSIGEGGRFVAMVLGENFLGQSYLAESHPWNIANRSMVGRERLTNELKWSL